MNDNEQPTPPADDVRKALSLVVLRASHEEKPVWDRGLEEIVDAILAAFEVRPRGPVTDDEVAAALDARATMSSRHVFLYATEKCRCGEEWSDAHWMRYILEAARGVRS